MTSWVNLCTHLPNLKSSYRGLNWVHSYTLQIVSTPYCYLKSVSLGQFLGMRKAHSEDRGENEPTITQVQIMDQLVVTSLQWPPTTLHPLWLTLTISHAPPPSSVCLECSAKGFTSMGVARWLVWQCLAASEADATATIWTHEEKTNVRKTISKISDNFFHWSPISRPLIY